MRADVRAAGEALLRHRLPRVPLRPGEAEGQAPVRERGGGGVLLASHPAGQARRDHGYERREGARPRPGNRWLSGPEAFPSNVRGVQRCGNCGREAPDDFAFCPACGTPFASEPQAGARRTVTILFADMVGSTALGERLDPERLQGVLTRYYDALRGVIERHGGTVEKFIGDAVMAVFGIPNIREDDALRAVRAAAELEDALGDLNGELESSIEARVHIRVGINTGEVVVTSGAEGTLAAGDAVNVAARLEQAAGVGEILIGAETYQLVRDAVLADRLDPLSVKGKAEPLSVFRVQKVDPAASGFARRLDAPIVGRQRELSLLMGAFDRAMSDQSSHLFTVLGVGGVGKSRLVDAFVVALGDRATVMSGRCPPYGDGITFLPLVQGVRQVVGLTGTEGAD